MRRLVCGILLSMLGTNPVWAAPILAWDAVTTDTTGAPLGPGLEVSAYKVYKCGTALSGPCAAPDRVVVNTVAAPATQLDLAGQAFPQVYVVTAVNRAGESLDSAKFKVTPADAPKNLRLP